MANHPTAPDASILAIQSATQSERLRGAGIGIDEAVASSGTAAAAKARFSLCDCARAVVSWLGLTAVTSGGSITSGVAVAVVPTAAGDSGVSVGSGTSGFCCSNTGGGSKGVTLASDELCGTELGRKEPGTRLGRPSAVEVGADLRSDAGARLGRSKTSAGDVDSADVLFFTDAGALEKELGPVLCDSGTLARTLEGAAVLGLTEAI